LGQGVLVRLVLLVALLDHLELTLYLVASHLLVVEVVETLMAFLVLLAGLVEAALLMAVTLVREHQDKVLLVVKAGHLELSMLAVAAAEQVLLELLEKAVVAHRETAVQAYVPVLQAHKFFTLVEAEAVVLLASMVD
tara:strand:+ start:1996 stop:2406 length:411 start_codon:yes stop_codon:yes gene_type:complete